MINRQPSGIPIGGQYAPGAQGLPAAEPLVGLPDGGGRRWGSANIREGSRTPWGTADNVSHPAPGIAQVSTPGHGGVKLSRERNAAIPAALRDGSGWYEEDCEVDIVGMFHPEAFPHYLGGDPDAIRAACARSVKDWFPDKYEAATGETIPLDESYGKREQAKRYDVAAFRAEHAERFVTVHRGGDDTGDWVPEGYKPMAARIDATGETREFLVPEGECVENGSFVSNRLVDPHRHIDITGIGTLGDPVREPERPKLTGDALGIDYSGLTTSQRNRAAAELNKRWRFQNDDKTQTVESLGDHFARVGVTGKKPIAIDNGVGYFVEYGGSSSVCQKVSKAAYDALAGVPDSSDDAHRASIAVRNAEQRLERAQRDCDPDKARKARAAADAAHADYKAADAAKRANDIPYGRRQQMRAEALRALLDSRGIDSL